METLSFSGIEVTLHRTVRVAEGRAPANLPPSMGRAKLYPVAEFKEKCPASWDENGFLVPLHDTEALWIALRSSRPRAVLIGAGGVNAVTGEKLGTVLAEGNYLTLPRQPWIDGWKSDDGSVYQFVATPYKGGSGLSVAEQLIGEESKTGGIGLAVFEPKDPDLAPAGRPSEGLSTGAYAPMSYKGGGYAMGMTLEAFPMRGVTRGASFGEIGVGKGGKIAQKIYADPHGLAAWQESPAGTRVVYLVDAVAFAEMTGDETPKPVAHGEYQGKWHGLDDGAQPDVAGSSKFHGLGSAFAGDTSNVEPKG